MSLSHWMQMRGLVQFRPELSKIEKKLPTESQLNDFELHAKVKLPASYRSFMRTFGPGEFLWMLKIAGPDPKQRKSIYNLEIAKKRYGYAGSEVEDSHLNADQKALLRRLYYFGLERSRDWLAWDTKDIRNRRNHEYAIYRVGWLRDGPILAAASFRELVDGIWADILQQDPVFDDDNVDLRFVYESGLPTR